MDKELSPSKNYYSIQLQREIDLYSKKDDVFDNVLDQMYQADVQRIR